MSVRPLATLGAGWIVGIAVAGWTAVTLLDPGTDQFMRDFWTEDFLPGQPGAALSWVASRVPSTFAHSLIFVPADDPVLQVIVAVPLVLAVMGLVLAFRSHRSPVVFLLAPLAAGLTAAAVHLLPFDQRLGLHAAWPVLVLAAFGLTSLRALLPGRWKVLAGTLASIMTVPLVLIVLLAARPPYVTSRGAASPREALAALAERREPGDRIYVYTQGRHDMSFYGARVGIEDWVQGDRHFEDPRGYLREVDAMRGEARVWFFWVRLDRDEPGLIRSYLETIGQELDRIPDDLSGDSGVVLYDLSDPERLARTTAESFPLPDIEGDR